MTTSTLTDDEVLEQLDFGHIPVCRVSTGYGILFFRWSWSFPWNRRRCQRRAQWYLMCLGCRRGTYLCDAHHEHYLDTPRRQWWNCSKCLQKLTPERSRSVRL